MHKKLFEMQMIVNMKPLINWIVHWHLIIIHVRGLLRNDNCKQQPNRWIQRDLTQCRTKESNQMNMFANWQNNVRGNSDSQKNRCPFTNCRLYGHKKRNTNFSNRWKKNYKSKQMEKFHKLMTRFVHKNGAIISSVKQTKSLVALKALVAVNVKIEQNSPTI